MAQGGRFRLSHEKEGVMDRAEEKKPGVSTNIFGGKNRLGRYGKQFFFKFYIGQGKNLTLNVLVQKWQYLQLKE